VAPPDSKTPTSIESVLESYPDVKNIFETINFNAGRVVVLSDEDISKITNRFEEDSVKNVF
jgi:hypothetical protein